MASRWSARLPTRRRRSLARLRACAGRWASSTRPPAQWPPLHSLARVPLETAGSLDEAVRTGGLDGLHAGGAQRYARRVRHHALVATASARVTGATARGSWWS